jgi:hypothetical protein
MLTCDFERAVPTWRVIGGEMTWPLPDEGMDELEWRLRYAGEVPKTDRLVAASILSAYRELVACNRRKRELVVRELKGG